MSVQGGPIWNDIAEINQEPMSESELPTVPERWSAPQKTEVVFRLLRGEPLDCVSRESQVPAHELEQWQRTFIEA
jgi:hypothetical protein